MSKETHKEESEHKYISYENYGQTLRAREDLVRAAVKRLRKGDHFTRNETPTTWYAVAVAVERLGLFPATKK